MDQNIFGFIYRYSVKHQIFILVLTLVSFPFLYYSLDLPKLIVNQAIGGHRLPRVLLGVPVTQVQYLLLLSVGFLAMVVINGIFKYHINNLQGRVGERMLRRLRYELYARVLRFPLAHFKKTSQGEIIPMITTEVEPLGGFIGTAFALPAFQGGTLLVNLVFIFIQDPVLGAAAVSLYPLQGLLIPRLQRKVRALGRDRVRRMRSLADRIGESVAGVTEIHAHDTAHFHLAEFASRLGEIFDIRYDIYRRKYFVRFLNNFINQLTPFFFYSIGGYLVIKGNLSLGALTAVLAAYKDLASPWKELLDYYQSLQDIQIKYEQVVEQFQPPAMMDPALQIEEPPEPVRFAGELVLSGVSVGEEGAARALDSISVVLPLDRHVAIVGGGGSGKDDLALVLARLSVPASGRVLVDGHDYASLPESVTGRRIAYVGPGGYVFTASLRDNLYYGLKHRPLRPPPVDGLTPAGRRRWVMEAEATGNTIFDIAADWIDYDAAGCDGPDALSRKALEVLADVDLDLDVYLMGLHGTIDPEAHPETARRVLEARAVVRERLADPKASALVEPFDPDRYNSNATVAENLLFGTPVGPAFSIDHLVEHPYVRRVLDTVGLTQDFVRTGQRVAETMIELFADLPPTHEFFQQFSFIGAEDLPGFQALLQRVGKTGPDGLKPDERFRLMALPFKLITARHRLNLIDGTMEDRILEARRAFARDLPPDLAGSIEFFRADAYNATATIQDNILFGKLAYGQSQAQARVGRLISGAVEAVGLHDTVMQIGLDQPVGVAGARLSAAQRQKLALGRALIKNPDILILNEATAALDSASQSRIHEAILAHRQGRSVIWAVHRPDMARRFHHVLVLRAGQLVEQGSPEALAQPGQVLAMMSAAD